LYLAVGVKLLHGKKGAV